MRRLAGAILVIVALALAAGAPAAGAKTITRGQVALPDEGGCNSCDVFQLDTATGSPSYKVPKGRWKIIEWSAQGGGTSDGEALLRVYRPTGTAGQFKLVRESAVETIPADDSPKFATKLKVKAGDLLGIGTIDNLASATSSVADAEDEVAAVGCDPTGPGLLVGSATACPLTSLSPSLANIWAKLKKL